MRHTTNSDIEPHMMREPIAIVGSACRFPGASSPAKLWDLLQDPSDLLSDFEPGKLNLSSFYHPDGEHHGSTNVTSKSYLLEGHHRDFDASFFNINPAEADGMDPQQRILLETTYEAFEAAGYTLQQLQGSPTSVFVGVMTSDFQDIQTRDLDTIGRWHATGTAPSILSNRISYCFNLKGPSMTINTACSSSLVALHQAVQSLRNGESKTAIVGGVNLILDPETYIGESKLHMLSPTSRCRMWDQDADGYARGEGCATVILKSLSQALADGDEVEAIIRETSVNSDGRSPGITMPDAEAQTTLIKQTYINSGLDPVIDRCQYFECHGTGTLAGDPVEAQAIQMAFFPQKPTSNLDINDRLYVGSIKTVIGHQEGCAGLAGLLKAVACIKNRTITPNLHFTKLNPNIAPFYEHLQIPTRSLPWPSVPAGSPLRASVNSFGFGGTNAHAIIESYPTITSTGEQNIHGRTLGNTCIIPGPFVFSAQSQVSLLKNINNTANYIKSNPSLNLNDLAWVLAAKRTPLPLKLSFTANNRTELLETLDNAVLTEETSPSGEFGTLTRRSQSEGCRILGVFTGQGAQWATMGRQLILSSPVFRDSIDRCECALSRLPDGPSWSLKAELMADQHSSRISEAALSQPLTTAIEIAVVDLLSAAGVHHDVVVGHSSGEIAAAYAAGIISSDDAIKIAYYRGFHVKVNTSPEAQQTGGMLAVGITFEQAMAFCAQSTFHGRIVVAASNAPASITLSGDYDAISEAKQYFDQKKIFSRILKVEVAYHSHHMRPYADAYLASLKACKIQVQSPKRDCTWVSSVQDDLNFFNESPAGLDGQYWVDNMLQPVRFSQAIQYSLQNEGRFSLCMEVGPHTALKGPVLQSIDLILTEKIPYISLLQRGVHDLKAASSAMGFIWQHLGPQSVDLDRYHRSFRTEPPRMLKDFPGYSWDHSKEHWRESRISRRYRLGGHRPHALLGRRAPDDSDHVMRWRNIIHLNELPWLQGYRHKGQVIFPAAAYVPLALETAASVAGGRPVALIELHDLHILKRLKLEEGNSGAEIVTTLIISDLEPKGLSETQVEAQFACDICPSDGTALERSCNARMVLHFGHSSTDDLPSRQPRRQRLTPVDPDDLYNVFQSVGLDYTGPFRGIDSMSRTLNHATASACWSSNALFPNSLFNPAAFELAFQSILGAFASPLGNSLRDSYLPATISRIFVNSNVAHRSSSDKVHVDIDASVSESNASLIVGDVSMFDSEGHSLVQVEGVILKPDSDSSPLADRNPFSHIVWESDPCLGAVQVSQHQPGADEESEIEAMERTALFYFQRTLQEIDSREVLGFRDHHRIFYNEISRVVNLVKNHQHPTLKHEWIHDSEEYITTIFHKFKSQAELKVIHQIGPLSSAILRDEIEAVGLLKHLPVDRLLLGGVAFAPMYQNICDVIKRIAHKNPQMKILEIGAGAGVATRRVIDTIGDAYASYTYTDISPELVETAAEEMASTEPRMTFKVLDIERAFIDQGYEGGSYDLVLLSNPLYANQRSKESLQRIRSLLRPGGYLLFTEVTGHMVMSLMSIMGVISEWWLGYDGRRPSWPSVSPAVCDQLLRSNGFSGVDGITHNLPDSEKHCFSVIVSQAVDDSVMMLREPTFSRSLAPVGEQILIIGGRSLAVSRLVHNLKNILSLSGTGINIIDEIDSLDLHHLSKGTSVICASELDKPLFSDKGLSQQRVDSLQLLFRKTKCVLWLTAGRLSTQPNTNIAVGVGRATRSEEQDVNLQFLDIPEITACLPQKIVDVFLRLSWSRLPLLTGEGRQWTNELEIHFNGQDLLIPRLIQDHEKNDRYNSGRRQGFRQINTVQQPVEIKIAADGNPHLQVSYQHSRGAAASVPFKAKLSIPLLQASSKRLFLWLGVSHNGEHTAMGISDYNSSIIQADMDSIYILDQVEVSTALFQSTASFIIANLMAYSTPSDGSVLVYSPHEMLAAAITKSPHWRGRHVHFVKASSITSESSWIVIHPRASRQTVLRALPKDVLCFFDLSTSQNDSLGTILRDIYEGAWQGPFMFSNQPFDKRRLISVSYAEAKSSPVQLSLDTSDRFSVSQVHGLSASMYSYPSIIDWAQSNQVSVQSQSLDVSALFSSSKTYLMVDLTTPLGYSILLWMAANGARYFVLASDNVKVDQDFLEEVSALGAAVKVVKMNIADPGSVSSVCAEITATLPPVAGICSASMDLSINTLEDTAVNSLTTSSRPTAQGISYLDDFFSRPTLDFFIVLSSLAALIGMPGQPYQQAASLFMSGLVQQRRKKGLAASMVHIGMVVDVGYIARQKRHAIDRMKKLGYAALSESDVHHSFAEAVLASPHDSVGSAEIVIGLEPIKRISNGLDHPAWCSNPLLSHFTVNGTKQEEQQEQTDLSKLSLREQLKGSISRDKAFEILLKGFSGKVESMLNLSPGSLDTGVPLLDLGFDSLLAVEIKTWVFWETEIDIPVSSTLQLTSLELCKNAVTQFFHQIPQKHASPQSTDDSESTGSHTSGSKLGLSGSDQATPSDSGGSETSTGLSSAAEIKPSEVSPLSAPSKYQRVEQMSPYQSLIWFAGNYMKDPSQYNVVISYDVKGTFQPAKFEQALHQVVSWHESLRTAFFTDPVRGQLMQGVMQDSLPFFRHIETTDPTAVSKEFENAASHDWQLEQGETFKVTVVSVSSEQHTVIFSYHHIIMDGVSWSVFLRDLKCFYELGTPPPDAPQYIDYSMIQNRAIQDGTFSQEIDYWKRELSPLPEVMSLLPFAKVKHRTPSDDFAAHTTGVEISKGTAEKVKKTSLDLRGTAFQFYLATLHVLFSRLLNTENVCIGMGDANRKQGKFANTIGYFVNVVPVQVSVSQDDTFATVFQRTSGKVLSALSNSSVPSNLVVDALRVQRASDHTPLFQVALNYRVGEITKMSVAGFELNYSQSVMGNAPYDMSFHVTPTAAGTCILELTYRDCLYTHEAAKTVLSMYTDLIDAFASNPSLVVQDCPASPPACDERHLSIRRGPRLENGWPMTLPARFQNVVNKFGENIAIKEESGEFTYSQLEAHTNRIANALLSEGITRGAAVGVLCQPSLSSVASMLAVLRIGAIHLPLDLSIPAARHTAMIEASSTKVIMCSSSTRERAMGLDVSLVINADGVANHSAVPVQNRSSGTAPSVLLYTSGSTGKPKGVLLPQVGFINYLAAKEKELSLDSTVTILQQSSIGFDMGLAQTLNAVMNGGKLVIVPQSARGDPVEIAKLMRTEKVTFTLACPSEYLAILQHAREHLKGYALWRYACLGGEPFTDRLKQEFAQLGANCPLVQDSYGVTEISACTTFETMTVSQVEGARSVGKAIPNTSLYVLDENHDPVDIGTPGEICVGGIGIALGYLDKEQTKLKFLEDPFATADDIARGWTQMYRTGDKGRLLEDGSLIHMGRMDGNTEIKLRGLRIDLEDVGSTLVNSSPRLLSSAVVCTKGEGDAKILVAYVALVPGQTASDSELQVLASSLPLPQYMCPAKVICLDNLPRNANGKIDRKAIEAMPLTVAAPQPLPSSRLTLGEGELKLLWQGILPNNPRVQSDSDFFMLGGNSLLLVKLQSAIRTSIGISISLRDLYGASTLSSMATKVDAEKARSPSKSVNWFKETLIPEAILETANTIRSPHQSRSTGCEILLTGSTSFLGRTIVQALLGNPAVGKVHCIAVEKGTEDVLTVSDKVVVYHGSLLEPALGLSTAEHAALQSCIDVVVHAGSNGHCLNFYTSLRVPNLHSTHFLAQFCLQSQIPLHYISSPRVILLSGKAALGPVSVSSHPPPADGSEGLTAAKWASESFLERFAEQTGSPVCIHRPCTAIGDNAPHQDALNSLLRYSDILGATPRMTNMDGYLDFQKVEILAEDIATQVMEGIDSSLSSVVFRHYSSDVKVPVKSFKEYMEKVHNRPFGEFSLSDWSTRALELGIEPLIPSFLEAVAENPETMYFPYLGI